MEDYVEYAARPGQFGLSFVAIAGLSLLCAVLWHVMPGFVTLLMLPALAACLYQMVVTPVYGLRMGRSEWTILAGDQDQTITSASIAYLRVASRGAVNRATVILQNGTEIDIPVYLTQYPLALIRETTNRGIPVRSS
jgi:hypothetical protein